jgi:hypothetical protein
LAVRQFQPDLKNAPAFLGAPFHIGLQLDVGASVAEGPAYDNH